MRSSFATSSGFSLKKVLSLSHKPRHLQHTVLNIFPMAKKNKTMKQLIATALILIFISSQILFFIHNAQAAVSISNLTGSCSQNSGTTASGTQNTVYSIGTIQITTTNAEINPGQDDSASTQATTGNARATNMGSISNNGDIIGNIFSIVPPTGTKFVILSGKEDSLNPNNLAQSNATINNSLSQDSMGVDSSLGINVGVVTAGTVGVDRVIVAITRDADSTSNVETYPKSGTANNTATITITGLGLSIPPSGNTSLSGTLQATIDSVLPSGIGQSGGVSPTLYSAIPGFTGTLNICTIGGSSTTSSSSSSSSSGSTSSTSSPIMVQTTSNSNDTCAPVLSTSIYSIMTIQITARTADFNPAPDDAPTTSQTTGNARATNGGRISSDGDVIGNIFSLVPPAGAKFVILPSFENTLNPTLLSNSNATISNAFSTDTSNPYSFDDLLGISVGVVTTGSAGNGRAIVAIARDADGAVANNYEQYPKSGTGNNTATITINGLGIQFDSELPTSSILQITTDIIPPAGIGRSGGYLTSGQSPLQASAFPGLPTTSLSICTFRGTSSTSSSSGSLSSSSSSSSSGSISSTSSSSSGSTSASSSGVLNNCPPCLASGSQCPTNCPENLTNCNGVAYLNICDYQRIRCGCGTSSSSTSTSGGVSSTSSTSSSSGTTTPTVNLNSNFSGLWKGVAKVTSSSGKSISQLAVLKLCVSDGELTGTVNVSGVINSGEILSQNIKSENEVDVDVADRNDDISSINLKLVNNRRLSIAIEDVASFLTRKTKTIKQCLQSFRKSRKIEIFEILKK